MKKKPAPKKPTPGKGKDPFPWWLLAIAGAVIVAMTAARRWTIPTFLALAVIGWALTINWLPIRKRLGVVCLLATWATLGASWPFGLRLELWHAISWGVFLGLGAWAAWNVGRVDLHEGHKKKRKESLIRMAWPDFRDNIGAKGVDLVDYDEHTDDEGNVVRIVMVLKNPPGNPFNPAAIAKDIDNVGRGGRSFPAGSTRFDKGELEGDWIFTTDLRKPWQIKPDRPPVERERFALGWSEWGDLVWIEDTLNALVFGETGSGKSNTINNVIEARLQQGYRVLLIDPKKVELYPWRTEADDYADNGTDAVRILSALKAEMEARNQYLRERHRKKWKVDRDGPRIACFIDEYAELGAQTPEVNGLCSSLAALCRSAGIEMWFVTQYPTEKSIPQIIKQNTPVVIGHRVKNGTANRAGLDEDANAKGFDLAQALPAGRAVSIIPGHDWRWVQVFEVDDPAEVEPATPAPVPPRPDTPPWPAPSVRLSDPTTTPPTQAEHPRTDGRTDKPDNQPDPILAALDDHEPRTIPQVMEATKLTKYQVHTALQKHEKEGRVCRPHGANKGYVRAT